VFERSAAGNVLTAARVARFINASALFEFPPVAVGASAYTLRCAGFLAEPVVSAAAKQSSNIFKLPNMPGAPRRSNRHPAKRRQLNLQAVIIRVTVGQLCSVVAHSDVEGAENLRRFISTWLRFMQLEQARPRPEIDRVSATGPYATNHDALDGERSRMRGPRCRGVGRSSDAAPRARHDNHRREPEQPRKNKDQARRCVSVSATVLSSIGLEADAAWPNGSCANA